MKKFTFLQAIIFSLVAILSTATTADWTVDQKPLLASKIAQKGQDIVISFQRNPVEETEAACLAVTLARSLSLAGANVTLFPTVDGAVLGNYDVADDISKAQIDADTKCMTPWGQVTLQENLEEFLAFNPATEEFEMMNNMLVCPLCWWGRYGMEAIPDYGVLNPAAVGAILLGAEKIFDI